MNRLDVAAWLGIAAVVATAIGALVTLGWKTLGTIDAVLTVALVVAFVAASVLLGRRDAGSRTPYW